MNPSSSVAPKATPDSDQLRYAMAIQWGARLGLALLIASYAALLLGFSSSQQMGMVAIGLLSAISIAGLVILLPGYLKRSDYWLVAICCAQALFIAAVALGAFMGGV